MTRIHVETLGRLRVERDGEELPELPSQPVRCALLVYLALERNASRDELAALLWPERDADRARHSLSQTLYELRRGLGSGWINTHKDRVEVTDLVTVDALGFVAAVEAARDGEALAIYQGAFLGACHLGATEGFQSWMDRRRSHLSRLHRDLCRRFTSARITAGDAADALIVARRWAEMDPLDDEAHHHIIALLAETGRRSEALRHYDGYRELIAGELEIEPLDETKELVARIREGVATAAPGRDQAEVFPAQGGVEASAPPSPVTGARLEPAGPAPREKGSAPAPSATIGRRWQPAVVIVALMAGVVLLWSGARDVSPVSPAADATSADPQEGIAVLPFLNLSEDPGREYFADGITEDLLTNLSRIQGLRVISRTSAMRYKGTEIPVHEIARELGVRYVVEGSVRREGDQVRITAQLIDAANGAQLWAESYDRKMGAVFEVQSEIAENISEQLHHRLRPAERARIAAGGTAHVAAYDLLLRGREYLNRPGAADVRKYLPAIRFFRQALEIDPGYARAYVGLSHAFREQVALPIAARTDSALVYARKAVELDPGSAEAIAALGLAHLIGGQWTAAEQALGRALELDPSQGDALTGRARLAWMRGRLDDAVRWQQRAVGADPFSGHKLAALGGFLFDLGDLPGAERALRRSVELAPDSPVSSFLLAQLLLIRGDPGAAEQRMQALEASASDHPGTQFLLGRFHAQRGRYEIAEEHLARSAAVLGRGLAATLSLQRAYVAGKLGREDRAVDLLARAEADLAAQEREGASEFRLRAQLHTLRGERDRAIAVLRRWEREPGGKLLAGPQVGRYWIDHDPLLEDLRTEPEFRILLRQRRAAIDSMRLLLRE